MWRLIATIWALLWNTVVAASTDGLTPVVVKFGSVCCGIDTQARERLQRAIAKFERAHTLKIALRNYSWGKEGEVTICFALTELGAAEVASFKAVARDAISDSDRTIIYENVSCLAPDRDPESESSR